MLNEDFELKETIVLIVEDAVTGAVKQHIVWDNLVTDAGDIYYAELIEIGFKGSGAPTNSFNTLELGTAGNTPTKSSNRSDMTSKVASSQQTPSTGYPTVNDTDSLNTGAGVDILTWKFEYGTSLGSVSNIDRAIITNASPGASEPILNYSDSFTGGTFSITANDTLTCYANHRINGV